MATHLKLVCDPEDKNLIILQSLICLLRERNILSRADIEELCATVKSRATVPADDALPRQQGAANAAATEVALLGEYIGKRYGGKHRRVF